MSVNDDGRADNGCREYGAERYLVSVPVWAPEGEHTGGKPGK